jgi:hypothetical protein
MKKIYKICKNPVKQAFYLLVLGLVWCVIVAFFWYLDSKYGQDLLGDDFCDTVIIIGIVSGFLLCGGLGFYALRFGIKTPTSTALAGINGVMSALISVILLRMFQDGDSEIADFCDILILLIGLPVLMVLVALFTQFIYGIYEEFK